jgi:AcrR family transcriptional regulator
LSRGVAGDSRQRCPTRVGRGRSTRQQSYKIDQRAALLGAALDGFTRRGYDATSDAELAATTGVSKAAVSYHFRTKDDAQHALADRLLDSLDAILQRHPHAPWRRR